MAGRPPVQHQQNNQQRCYSPQGSPPHRECTSRQTASPRGPSRRPHPERCAVCDSDGKEGGRPPTYSDRQRKDNIFKNSQNPPPPPPTTLKARPLPPPVTPTKLRLKRNSSIFGDPALPQRTSQAKPAASLRLGNANLFCFPSTGTTRS